ncbi:TPA: colicin E3/pyocin S6 family cytotoxin [Staphylococcus aureus]
MEVYNSKGKHIGVMDPLTGKMIKPAVKGRKIKL